MLVLVLVLALLAPSSAVAGWRLPVDGAVAAPFRFDPAHPFAAGQRRGVDLRARPGAPVRAACTGAVAFAGAVPGRARAVTVRCAQGPWVATHVGLAATAVRAGRRVRRGERLGTVSAAGIVRLGARREGERHGYADPLALLASPAVGPPPLLPDGRRRAPRPPVAPPKPAPARRPVASPVTRGAPAHVPVIAWVGLGALAAGTPLGLLRRRRARRRAALASGAREPAPAGR